MHVTIGCDPELFVTKDGKFRCAHNLVPGTKEKPHRVRNGAVQVDGFALEYNIDPANTREEFVKFNLDVLDQLKEMVPGYDFAIVPSARFNGNHFRAQPDEAKELGCTPDYDAYTLKENVKPDNKTTMRTAAGHIHLGFCENASVDDPDHHIRCAVLVKQLDAYLGLPSLLWDRDKNRRQMYGKAGAYRPKPYGVEYRVLSNAWLLSEDRMKFVYDLAQKAVEDLVNGIRPFEKIGDASLQYVINGSDNYSAKSYIRNYLPDGDKILKTASTL